jgi:hypothetical protein
MSRPIANWARRTLAGPKLLLQHRDTFKHPAVEWGVINLHAALCHHFLELTIADRIRRVPADAPQDYIPFKMTAFAAAIIP